VTAATVASDAVHLRRVRWAVRAALVLGVVASVAANVLHAEPTVVGRAIAAWSPLALLVTVELISRVPVHRRTLARVRLLATAGIAGIAAWVSYWHMVAVALRYGEGAASAHLIPFSVDGLVVVASVCLVELAERIQHTDIEQSAVPVVAADCDEGVPAGERPAVADPAPALPERTRTGTRRRDRAGTRPDVVLIAALADVPRDADGSVPVRRAAAALSCGPDRARRLLAAEGLLRSAPPAVLAASAAVTEVAA